MQNINEESKFDKFNKKFIDNALSINTDGEYSGKWKYDFNERLFKKEVKESSYGNMHKSFSITDIFSIEQLSQTKNLAGIGKSAIVGAVIAGPLGAIAAGAYAGSKNSLFVEIIFKNDVKLHGHVSQAVYEEVLTITRSPDTSSGFIGITTVIPEENNYSGATLLLIIVLFLVIAGYSA